jgi:Protein of unknown function (DUF1236)
VFGPIEIEKGAAMKYLSPVCLAVALVALTVPGSAKTSLTPGQSAKIYRTVIPQGRGRAPIVREQIVIKLVVPMPLARKRIDDLPGSANSTLVNDALAVPDAPANTDKVPVVNDALAVPDAPANTDKVLVVNDGLAVSDAPANTDKVSVVNDALAVPDAPANTDKVPVVNDALAVSDAPANTDTVPAKFSPKNAADDKLITTARVFKMLTNDERRAIYQALKDQAAPDIGTKLPPGVELQPIPDAVAARVPQTRGYQYAVVKDRVLLVGTGRIVAGVFADSPVTEGCREGR